MRFSIPDNRTPSSARGGSNLFLPGVESSRVAAEPMKAPTLAPRWSQCRHTEPHLTWSRLTRQLRTSNIVMRRTALFRRHRNRTECTRWVKAETQDADLAVWRRVELHCAANLCGRRIGGWENKRSVALWRKRDRVCQQHGVFIIPYNDSDVCGLGGNICEGHSRYAVAGDHPRVAQRLPIPSNNRDGIPKLVTAE